MIRFIVGAENWFIRRDDTISFGMNGDLKLFRSKEAAEAYLAEKEFDDKFKVFKLEITEA